MLKMNNIYLKQIVYMKKKLIAPKMLNTPGTKKKHIRVKSVFYPPPPYKKKFFTPSP